MTVKNPEELKHWLKDRKKHNLRVSSNSKHRTLAFADISSSEYIICDISAFIRNRDLYDRYININELQNTGKLSNTGMINKWLSIVFNLQ